MIGGIFKLNKKQRRKMAESNFKILKSGKLKVKKGQKINLRPFITNSVENSVVGRLDGIISKENVVVDTEDLHQNVTSNMLSDIHVASLAAKTEKPGISTLVVTVNKKNALDAFDLMRDDSLGILLRTSTLTSCYMELKQEWKDLNEEDNSNFTNVLYVPEVMVFVDPDTGKLLKKPFNVNIIILAIPTKKNMSEQGVEEFTDEMAASRVIADIMDSAIKLGCKVIIIDPYCHKYLISMPYDAGKLWNNIVSTQRCIEQFKSIIFAIEDEELFVSFNAASK